MSDHSAQIQQLINNNKVILFMKGTVKFPLCGFSGHAVKLLASCGVTDFLSINVLEDENLRQGIKEFSNWPTIPQLYINGQFIGGADIIAEMHASGELQNLLHEVI